MGHVTNGPVVANRLAVVSKLPVASGLAPRWSAKRSQASRRAIPEKPRRQVLGPLRSPTRGKPARHKKHACHHQKPVCHHTPACHTKPACHRKHPRPSTATVHGNATVVHRIQLSPPCVALRSNTFQAAGIAPYPSSISIQLI